MDSLRTLASSLVGRGHNVTVVCSDMLAPGARAKRHPAGATMLDGVRVHHIRSQIRYRWDAIGLSGVPILRRALAEADVLHAFGTRHFLGVVAERAAADAGVPFFVMPEGSLPAREHGILRKRVMDVLHTNRSLDRAYRIVAASLHEANDLMAAGFPEDRILVLPPRASRLALSQHPRNELRDRWQVPTESPVLLWLGRIHPVKGLSVLLDALEDPRLSEVRLLIGGMEEDAALGRQLRERANRQPLVGRIRFLGWVDAEAKSELFKLADLFVFPSLKENFGLAAAEAISSGLPAVLSVNTGIAAAVRGRASLTCDPEAGSIADAVHRTLKEPGLLDRFRAETTAVAVDLEWTRLVDVLEAAYLEAIEKSQKMP